jgi:hypothetical protein
VSGFLETFLPSVTGVRLGFLFQVGKNTSVHTMLAANLNVRD